MTSEKKAEFQMFVPEDDGSAMDWLENTLTQDRAALHTSLVAAVEEMPDTIFGKDIVSRVEVLTIINSIFKE